MLGILVEMHLILYREPQGDKAPLDPPSLVRSMALPPPKPPCDEQLKDIYTSFENSRGVGVVIHKCWRTACKGKGNLEPIEGGQMNSLDSLVPL